MPKEISDEKIIEKATRPGGEDFKKKGGFDKSELKWRKYKDEKASKIKKWN